MPGTTPGSYRALFSSSVVSRTFSMAMLGRFGYATLPLVLLFTVLQASGSFAIAAAASAVLGLSGLMMPIQARLIDRFTQRRVLPVAGSGFVVALAVMAVAGASGWTSPVVWSVVSVLGGVSAPTLGPSMRGQWRIFAPQEQRATAYSLDAIAEEVVFLLGPVAAAAILATGPAWHGMLPIACGIAVGVVGLTVSPAAAIRVVDQRPNSGAVAPPPRRQRWGPLRHASFRRLSVAMLLAGAGASAALTGTAARAESTGHPEWAGFIEAGAGLAAVCGGAVWGRWRFRGSGSTQLGLLLVGRAVLMLAAALSAGLGGVAPTMVLAGLVIAPTFVVAYTAADQITPAHQHTEASTWVTATHNVGTALGTASAGWTVAHLSLSAPFVASALFLVVGAVIAVGWAARRDST